MPPRTDGKNDLYLGVELEVELGPDLNYDDDPEYDEDGDPIPSPDDRTAIAKKTKDILGTMAYMKYDGSLESGFEIVTHPATLEYHLNDFPWNTLLTSLKDWGVQADSRRSAGLHVHFDKKFLSAEQQAKYAVFVYTFPAQVTAIARRSPSSYCTRKNISEYPPQSKRELHYSSNRYDAVNTTNEHTIEIRVFQATLRPNIMLSSLEFVDSIAHFVKERKTTSFDIDATIKTGDPELWKRYVNYVHKKNYPNLCQFLTTLNLV